MCLVYYLVTMSRLEMHTRQRTLPGHVDLMHILNRAVSTDLKWTGTDLGAESGGCDSWYERQNHLKFNLTSAS